MLDGVAGAIGFNNSHMVGVDIHTKYPQLLSSCDWGPLYRKAGHNRPAFSIANQTVGDGNRRVRLKCRNDQFMTIRKMDVFDDKVLCVLAVRVLSTK